jgi:dienelactone hydrolase
MLSALMAKPLPGYESFEYSAKGITHVVYVRGRGPGVLLMHELPGMVRECVELGAFLDGKGFRVYMPLMFGEAGERIGFGTAARLCISREFRLFAQRESSPVTEWLRALCVERIRPECPGPGIGAIGMCLSGGFVLSLFVSDMLLAPVVCQPGLPFGITAASRAALGVSAAHLAEAQRSTAPILGFRFEGDKICRAERFQTLRQTFGRRFEGHELAGRDHSVLTIDFVNRPDHPTFAARERVVAFLQQRLSVAVAGT